MNSRCGGDRRPIGGPEGRLQPDSCPPTAHDSLLIIFISGSGEVVLARCENFWTSETVLGTLGKKIGKYFNNDLNFLIYKKKLFDQANGYNKIRFRVKFVK